MLNRKVNFDFTPHKRGETHSTEGEKNIFMFDSG